MSLDHTLLFWGFLLLYGAIMYGLSPRSHGAASFYRGADARGNPVGQWSLTASIFISWIFAILGNMPMFAGTDILKATTISGTMVMGLAPVFLFYRLTPWSPWSFHLSFWSGVVLGILLAIGAIPEAWRIGEGAYGLLLGVNAWGLLICGAGFLLPLLLRRLVPLLRPSRLEETRR